MRRQFLDFVVSYPFTAEEVRQLAHARDRAAEGAEATPSAAGRLQARPFGAAELDARPRSRGSFWRILQGALPDLVPARFTVREGLPRPESGAPGARPESVACETFRYPFGVAVKLTFGFPDTPSDALVAWPAPDATFAVPGAERTTLEGFCAAIGRATVEQAGAAWRDALAAHDWAGDWGWWARRVYTEIRTDAPPLERPLFYGLTTGEVGWRDATGEAIDRSVFPYRSVRYTGEAQWFGGSGAALRLLGASRPMWSQGNCRRRDVCYALGLHGLALAPMHQLRRAWARQGDRAKLLALLEDSDVVAADLRRRLAVLDVLHGQRTYAPWLLYYADRSGLGRLPEALASRVQQRLGDGEAWARLQEMLARRRTAVAGRW